MKIVELLNNINIAITNEEADILGKFAAESSIDKKDLTPREQVLANSLVNKDILTRKNEQGHITYKKRVKAQ